MCGCVTFSDIMAVRNYSAVLHVIVTNLVTSALQFVTQGWAANAVSTDERKPGHIRQSSPLFFFYRNITCCVGIALSFAI